MTTGVNIQIEDGNWSKVHNEIWEALARAPLSGSEFRCLMVLFRLTYGWQKKEAVISYQQLEDETGLARRSVMRTMQGLLDKGIVYRKDTGNNRPAIWGFNKYVEQWSTSDETVTKTSDQIDTSYEPTSDQIDTKTSDETVTKTSDQIDTHIKIRKKRKKKEPPPPVSPGNHLDKEYAEIVSSYQADIGIVTYTVGEKLKAALDEHPAEWIKGAIQESAIHNKRSWAYAETILRRWQREGRGPRASPNGANETITVTRLEGDLYQ